MGIGLKVKRKDMEIINSKMVLNIQENGVKMKDTVKELFIIKMEIYTQANGSKENKTVKVTSASN